MQPDTPPLAHKPMDARPHRAPRCAPDCPACADDRTARQVHNRADSRRLGRRLSAGRGRTRRRAAADLRHPLAGLADHDGDPDAA